MQLRRSHPVHFLQNVQHASRFPSHLHHGLLAVNPDLVGISLNTTLTLNGSPTSVDQQNAITDATTAAQNYINNLLIGEELVINQLADAILLQTPSSVTSEIQISRSIQSTSGDRARTELNELSLAITRPLLVNES